MGKLDGSQKVLCVQASALRSAGWFTGMMLGRESLELLEDLIDQAEWRPRTAALEADPSWKQFVAYGVLTCHGNVFAYRRRKAGTEQRLHGKVSIGIGGHVEPRDSPDPTGVIRLGTLERAMYRELDEEARPARGASFHLAGLLHDDRELITDGKVPVGHVHLGVVYEIRCASTELTHDHEIDPLGWIAPSDLIDAKGMQYESWSALLADRLLPLMAVAKSVV